MVHGLLVESIGKSVRAHPHTHHHAYAIGQIDHSDILVHDHGLAGNMMITDDSDHFRGEFPHFGNHSAKLGMVHANNLFFSLQKTEIFIDHQIGYFFKGILNKFIQNGFTDILEQ